MAVLELAKKKIRVVELFAGVGGFRLGLEQSSGVYDTVWANQWEPAKKVQHAFDCYVSHFGVSKRHSNEDIATAKIHVPKHDLLVGGFPCQDYSVARTGARGIKGQKGELWWSIVDVISVHKPSYVVLENVDRLLKSPSGQRGRDFGIMLRCLCDLGYAVEWRVINAADYGYAQRRRRVYIVAFNNATKIFNKLSDTVFRSGEFKLYDYLYYNGFFSSIFPIKGVDEKKMTLCDVDQILYPKLADVSENFSASIYNAGIMIEGKIFSAEVSALAVEPVTLRDIRHNEPVCEKYFLNGSLEKWQYLKGAKKIPRVRPNGEPYYFSEGALCFPDYLDKPARTMLTSEASVNRSTHVIEDAHTGRLRVLTPIECERLNGFKDDWTNTGMPERFRYFVMGNALVVPIVTRIGDKLTEII